MFVVDLDDGKYTVQNDNGTLTAKRHGEEWPAANAALCGDSLSLAMMHKIEQQKEILDAIHTHMEMMIDLRMFSHSGLRVEDATPMQIFRILQGYNNALTEK